MRLPIRQVLMRLPIRQVLMRLPIRQVLNRLPIRQVLMRLPIRQVLIIQLSIIHTHPQQIPHTPQQSIFPIHHLHETPLVRIRDETPSAPHTSTQTRCARKFFLALAHTRIVKRQLFPETNPAGRHTTLNPQWRAHRRIDRRPRCVTAVVAQFGRQLWLRRLPKFPRKSGSTNSKS